MQPREGTTERADADLADRETQYAYLHVLHYTACVDCVAKVGQRCCCQSSFSAPGLREAQPKVTTFNTIIKVIEKCPGVDNKTEAVNL